MADRSKFIVFAAGQSFDGQSAIIGRRAAYEAAMAMGDNVVVYRFDGKERHWDLLVDRGVPRPYRLSKRSHLRSVLRVVELVPQKFEVGTGSSYRWVNGYLVPSITGEPSCRKE